MRSAKEYILLFLRGVGMGAADVIPGVSGGTIAFITGIYQELLESIKAINAENIRLLFSFDFKNFWKNINGNFLLTLGAGIALSLFTLARLISYLIDTYPMQLWSFFFGLILISAVIVLRSIKKRNVGTFLAVVIGTALAYGVTIVSTAESSHGLINIFLSGTIAICAMILPGISGSFILLLLGQYEYVINAIKELDILVLLVFAAGCVVGILSFVRILSWILSRYHDATVALLAGFMLGSLNKLWPWKQVLEYRITSDGRQVPVVEKSISPVDYYELTGNDPQVLQAILFMFLGILVIVAFERITHWERNI